MGGGHCSTTQRGPVALLGCAVLHSPEISNGFLSLSRMTSMSSQPRTSHQQQLPSCVFTATHHLTCDELRSGADSLEFTTSSFSWKTPPLISPFTFPSTSPSQHLLWRVLVVQSLTLQPTKQFHWTAEAAKWNSDIVHLTVYSWASTAVSLQDVFSEKACCTQWTHHPDRATGRGAAAEMSQSKEQMWHNRCFLDVDLQQHVRRYGDLDKLKKKM